VTQVKPRGEFRIGWHEFYVALGLISKETGKGRIKLVGRLVRAGGPVSKAPNTPTGPVPVHLINKVTNICSLMVLEWS
jgi:hypothetical protein